MTYLTSFNAGTVQTGPPADSGGLAAVAGEFLAFNLGDEAYGIDILHVQEIRSFEAPTRIASAPAHMLGVLNLRGVIVPIVDLRLRLGMAHAQRHLPLTHGDST